VGILARLLKPIHRQHAGPPDEPSKCPHFALVPHWQDVGDIGKPDRVASYTCDACHESLTPQEAAERHVGAGPTGPSL
jgi:hypothetical protein